MLEFDLPKNQSSIIKVLGIGGGGSNAVNHMLKQGIAGVDFVICNTDSQALESSPVPTKIQLGSKGLGAGNVPSVGKEAAEESHDKFKPLLEQNTQMLFITAGMGGGTGTGGAPVFARMAKEMGILTVGIVTMPFAFEGRKRRQQAEAGIRELRQNVDTLLIISNDKLREQCGDLKLSAAFARADNVLATAAKGIAEIITVEGYINVDFEDVKTVMKDSGGAIMGTGIAEGEKRARKAVEEALSSPLLNDNSIKGADNILLYIASGKEEISLDEVMEITDFIQTEAGNTADIIWGNGNDDSLENSISITIIATGFERERKKEQARQENKIRHKLEEGPLKEETPKNSPRNTENSIDEIKRVSSQEAEKEASSNEEKPETASPGIGYTGESTATVKKHTLFPDHEVKTQSEEVAKEREERPVFREEKPESYKTAERAQMDQKAEKRISRLKALSHKLKDEAALNEMEKVPAYVRKKVELKDTQSSSDSAVSSYKLRIDGDEPEIGQNTFLHDNVD